MFIITDEQTLGWLDKMYEFYKVDPKRHDQNLETLVAHIHSQRGGTIPFNEAMAAIGVQVYAAYFNSRQNPINLDDNYNTSSSEPMGSDQGSDIQS